MTTYFIEIQEESGEWNDTSNGEGWGDDFDEALSCWFYEAAHINSLNIDLDAKICDGRPFRVTTEDGVVNWHMDEEEQAVVSCG